MFSQRTADTVLPEGRAIPTAKRARQIVSSRSFGNRIQSAENEHPNSTSETSRPASLADDAIFQTSPQLSSEDDDAVQKAQMALLVFDANRTEIAETKRSEPSQDIPPDSKVEPNCASLYSPSSDGGRETRIREDSTPIDNQPSPSEYPEGRADESHISIQSRNYPNDSPPSIILSHNSQEAPNPDVPASTEPDRQRLAVPRHETFHGNESDIMFRSSNTGGPSRLVATDTDLS